VAILDDARRELAQKSRSQIEAETAYKWAARAVAAYERFLQDRRVLRWLNDCQEYAHEAVEHAALADSTGDTLRAVRAWMRPYIPNDPT
jgi:hypothetical protein